MRAIIVVALLLPAAGVAGCMAGPDEAVDDPVQCPDDTNATNGTDVTTPVKGSSDVEGGADADQCVQRDGDLEDSTRETPTMSPVLPQPPSY